MFFHEKVESIFIFTYVLNNICIFECIITSSFFQNPNIYLYISFSSDMDDLMLYFHMWTIFDSFKTYCLIVWLYRLHEP